MNDTKGLYNKYLVIKVVNDTTIENCFILHPGKDPAAVKALQAYAAATENKVLADDLYKWVGKPMLKPMTKEELRDLIGPGDEVVTWCEANGYDGIHPNLWFR